MNAPTIVIVGGGPRGISLLERVGAVLTDLGTGARVDVHIVDDREPGAGRVWVTDQSKTLCMNTLAGAVTLFTEPGATVGAAVREGPTMLEWIRLHLAAVSRGRAEPGNVRAGATETALDADIPASHRTVFDRHPADAQRLAPWLEEMRATLPESNPSRALYGEYLRWCFEVAVAWLPDGVDVHVHPTRAVHIRRSGDRELVDLADGVTIDADAVAVAAGWIRSLPDAEERALGEQLAGRAELRWVHPDNPIDQPFDVVPAERPAIVRGCGMGFFDAMAILTIGRGGRFAADAASPSGLRYLPSGREPQLIVTSHRGYPFLPKSEYGDLPPKAALPRLQAVLRELGGILPGVAEPDPTLKGTVDFDAQIWPAIVRDAYAAHAATLARVRPQAFASGADDGLGEAVRIIDATEANTESLDDALSGVIPNRSDRFHPDRLLHPAPARDGADVAALTAEVRQQLVEDLRHAEAGADDPVKAGLWVFSAARKPSALFGAHGRYTLESWQHRFRELQSIGAMAGSGPPAFRTRQLIALVDAGLVRFAGAKPRVAIDGGSFVLRTETLPGAELRAATLIDAWMHRPDVRRTADPLVRGLLDDGRLRPFARKSASGAEQPSAAPDVHTPTGRIIDADGTVQPRVHLAGIPLEPLIGNTTISPMPGTNPTMLQETDRIARSLITTALGAAVQPSIV